MNSTLREVLVRIPIVAIIIFMAGFNYWFRQM